MMLNAPKAAIDTRTEPQIPNGFIRSRAHMNVRDFPHWTSTHAFPLTRRTNSGICIVFWLIMATIATAITVWQVTVTVQNYLDYPIATQSSYKFQKHIFPAITICDANPYKRSIAMQNEQMRQFMDTYVYAQKKLVCSINNNCNFTSDATFEEQMNQFSLANYSDSISLQSKAQRLLTIIAAQNKDDLEAAKSTMDEMLQGCSFNTQDCYIEDWTSWNDLTMGQCYTFNLDSNRTVNRAGSIYGLRVIIKTNVSEYLPTSSSIGLVVLIHDQNEYPFTDMTGIYINPNTAINLGIALTQITRLDHPYGNCESGFSSNYLYNMSYSAEGCERSIYQMNIVDMCNCYDPAYPAPNKSVEACQFPDDIDCWSNVVFNSSDISRSCSQSCETNSYKVTRSSALWPSGTVTTFGKCEEDDYYNMTCKEMYSENGAFVGVYFENLSFHILNETPAWTVYTLLSNLGGTAGLWLGMYIISVIEIILLCAQLTLSCLSPKVVGKMVVY